jgi:hypothetical protein
MLILYHFMRKSPEPRYENIEISGAFARVMKDKNLSAILICMFLLECFYATMVIYSPLYLGSLGIGLPIYLSAILPIALLPFVVLPYELGVLADTKLGEKELLISGLLLMSLMCSIVAMTNTSSIMLWVIILTLSRVGASLVETMIFSYYFKVVKSKDIALVTLFGNIRNVAIIFVPCVGIIVSSFTKNYYIVLFTLMSLALFYGAVQAFQLKDTR